MIKAIFYKRSRKPHERIISFLGSHKTYYHCAFLFDNDTVADSRLPKGFDKYTHHSTGNCQADIFRILISADQEKQLRILIDEMAGNMPYDVPGILGYAWGRITGKYFHHPKKAFCSEAMLILLKRVTICLPGWKCNQVDPDKLASERIVFEYDCTLRLY